MSRGFPSMTALLGLLVIPTEPAYGRLARVQGVHCSFFDHPRRRSPEPLVTVSPATTACPPSVKIVHLIFESHDGRALVPIPKRSTNP
jgi:hypothetical protein